MTIENLNYLKETSSRFNKANIHVLCANLFEENLINRPKWVDPYIILNMGGKKILLTAFCINYIKLQKYGLSLIDINEAFLRLKDTIKHIEPDALIVLNHSLADGSLSLYETAKNCGINIDLIIGGHEHSPVQDMENKNIYYPLAFSKNMLKFCCEFNNKSAKIQKTAEFYSKGVEPDQEFLPELEEFEEKSGLNIPVARSTVNLEKRYSDPCSLGTFIADAMKNYAKTDIALFSTGYTSHALRYEKNKILTNYNLERAISATVALQKVMLTADDIKDIFNNALRNRYVQKSGNTRFLQCSQNITVVCCKNSQNWGMVKQIYINGNSLFDDEGEPLQKNEHFSCAIDPFVASGELGFSALKKVSKETIMKNGELVRIKDLFVNAIIEAQTKYEEGTEYPSFKLIDLSA